MSLVIRAWIYRLDPVRAALRAARLEAQLTRVDLEPALSAALTRRAFDLVIHDPEVSGLSRELVEARLRQYRHAAPIITLGDIDALSDAVVRSLMALRN